MTFPLSTLHAFPALEKLIAFWAGKNEIRPSGNGFFDEGIGRNQEDMPALATLTFGAQQSRIAIQDRIALGAGDS